jgi:AcrR family transcriptional regulator
MATSSNTVVSEESNRRGDIVRAAGRLFRENGYSATTSRAIADAVNMRSGSPFYHFKTKHDMLRAVVLEGIDRLYHAVVSARDAAGEQPPEKIFRAMLKAHLNELLGEEGQDCAAVLLHEIRHLDPETLAVVVQLRDRYEALWTDILKQLKKTGKIKDARPITRLFLMGAMNWTTLWFSPAGSLSPDQIADELAKWVLNTPE